MLTSSETETGTTREPAEVSRRKGSGGDQGGDAGRLDLRHSWQVVAGSILIPLGVVFILLAWYGAAHARVEQQQIPYMVSGSFAGLGCMVVGGLLYWGHWLYRMYDQAELHHEEQQQLLLELMQTMVAHGSATSNGIGAGEQPGYLATASGTVYHRADCPVIAHHPGEVRVHSALGGLRPCQICTPD